MRTGEIRMKLLKAKRLFVAAGVAAVAGVVPLLTATTASADQIDCVNYLAAKGYAIGPKVRAACDGVDSLGEKAVCQTKLIAIRVNPAHALEACVRA